LTTDPILFSSLNLAPQILETVEAEGYTTPTPIQAKTIPATLLGRDVLGCAQTGTGKTAAFALPILHKLLTSPRDKSHRGRPLARVLILSPTRELATQIAESFKTYGRNTGVSGTTIYGGVSQRGQVRDLERGIDVIVATPGRLLDLMEQGHVDLSGITTFVLDEADRMLDMGFITPIRDIARKIPKEGRQTLLFSATMPKEIQHLAESLLTDPVRVSVTPVASAAPMIEQRLFMVPRQQKLGLLMHLIEQEKVQRAVVFSKTKHGADKLCKRLVQLGVTATAIHGNKAQNQRDRALDAFKMGRVRVLVATDVAARGLDVDHITHVFNFDLPMEPEAYVHRIGRTGRAGATGISISFCDGEERDLLRQIERLTNKKIPMFPLPTGVALNIPLRDPNATLEEREREWGGHPERQFHPVQRHLRERHDHPEAGHRVPPHRPEHPLNAGSGGGGAGGGAGGGGQRLHGFGGGEMERPFRSPPPKRPGMQGDRRRSGPGSSGYGSGGSGSSGGHGGGHGGSGGGGGGYSSQRGGSNASNSAFGDKNTKDKGKPKWASAGKGKPRGR
jgi:ATP-dependent RNA helicase RhlE